MADTPEVYVICDKNCKFVGMTKEQILTAIVEAVNEGKITNVDAGFITTLKTINGVPLKVFVGTQEEYETLAFEERENLFALITDDTTGEGFDKAIESLQKELEELRESLINGTLVKELTLADSENFTTEITEAGIYAISIRHPSDTNYPNRKMSVLIVVDFLSREAISTVTRKLSDEGEADEFDVWVSYCPQGTNEEGKMHGYLKIEHNSNYEQAYYISKTTRIGKY